MEGNHNPARYLTLGSILRSTSTGERTFSPLTSLQHSCRGVQDPSRPTSITATSSAVSSSPSKTVRSRNRHEPISVVQRSSCDEWTPYTANLPACRTFPRSHTNKAVTAPNTTAHVSGGLHPSFTGICPKGFETHALSLQSGCLGRRADAGLPGMPLQRDIRPSCLTGVVPTCS